MAGSRIEQLFDKTTQGQLVGQSGSSTLLSGASDLRDEADTLTSSGIENALRAILGRQPITSQFKKPVWISSFLSNYYS